MHPINNRFFNPCKMLKESNNMELRQIALNLRYFKLFIFNVALAMLLLAAKVSAEKVQITNTTEPYVAIESIVLPDLTNDGFSEFGLLYLDSVDDKIRLQIFDGVSLQKSLQITWDNIYSSPSLHLFPDLNGNNAPEVGVFGVRTEGNNAGKPQILVKDLLTASTTNVYNWPANWTDVEALVLEDVNGDSVVDVAIQGVFKQGARPQLVIRDGQTGGNVATYSYPNLLSDPVYFQHSDTNNDGVREIATFGRIKRNNKIQIKIANGTNPANRFKSYNFPDNWSNIDWISLDDKNNDDIADWGLFGVNKLDGRPQLIIKSGVDPKGAIGIFAWSAAITNPTFVSVPDMNNDGVNELAVGGLRSNGRYQFQVKDGADRNVSLANHNLNLAISDVSHHVLPDFTADGIAEIGFLGIDDTNNYVLQVQNGNGIEGAITQYNLGSLWSAKPLLHNIEDVNNDGLDEILFEGIYSGQTKLQIWPLPDAANSREINLQILAINDFHGNIATSSSSFGGVGRADFLAANIKAAQIEADNSIFVSAGDLIGATPLISALFHDEPTIEAMNLIGLDINGVGNHEFDEGTEELLRMAYGGSHPVDGDLDGDGFAGANFDFLAANVVVNETDETLFPAYKIRTYQDVKVAFIGMTLKGTPTIVTPSGVAGLSFEDEVDTVNDLIPQLQEDNIESIVVLLHEGGFSPGGSNDCNGGLFGTIADITEALNDAVDLVIAGHTNDEFVCEIDGKWVTMADNAGRLFTNINVTLDRKTKDMTIVSINNQPNLQAGVTPDQSVTTLIDKYDALSAPLANAVVGKITSNITRSRTSAGESALGDLITDAQLQSTAAAGFGDAVVAFTNSGGIRSDLFFAAGSAMENDGDVTFSEAFGAQPFGNTLVTMSLTGAQIHGLLEQQWIGRTSPSILQVSTGFTYTWDASQPDGSKVDPNSVTIDGATLNLTASYRVTVNSFMADGGGNFPALLEGTDRLGGEIDVDALVTYLEGNSPIAPGPQNRITRLN